MTTKTENQYEAQAQKFLDDTKATLKVTYVRTGKYFPDDKEARDIYSVSLNRGTRGFTFEFGQSLNNSGRFKRVKDGVLQMSQGVETKPGLFKAPAGDWYRQWAPNKDFDKPGAYDILAAMTKHDPDTFENFCGEYGYDQDSRTAEKTYKAVKEEYQNLAMLFSDAELEKMQEIQ